MAISAPVFTPNPRPPSHAGLIWGAGILILLTLVIFIGVSQLSVIREFFSKASGEPAAIVVDTRGILGLMPRPWRNLAQGGEEATWRIGPLIPTVKALKPEYIRIDHIYDFHEVVGGTPGNLTFNFSKLDLLLDDIAATGAKPFISLSYMPPAISSGDIVAPPTNYADWQLVVQKTIEHISGTRGTSDVYYEVWNEPDLFGGWKYGGPRNYITLYNAAARGAANARGVKPFKLGGPANTALYKNWFDAMAKNAIANNVRWDFFSWHKYSTDIDQYRSDMVDIRQWLRAYPQLEATLELQLTEWGHDSENHPGYDTNYGAAHTVAGSIEMVGILERAFVFEIQDGKGPDGKESWGRWGLFKHASVGGGAKPRYQALRMLDRLGNERVQLQGKGSWVKALAARNDEGVFQVVLANFDPKGQNNENVPVTFKNIEPGSYTITQEFLSGSKQVSEVATSAAALQTFVRMTPNNVALVELKKQN